MKFYSELTKSVYDTEKDLVAAENELKKQQEVKEAKNAERAKRAKEVEDAYKAELEAHNNYIKLRNQFVNDYGSFHYSYNSVVPLKELDTLADFFNLFTF